MSAQLEKLEARKRKIEKQLKEARRKERERNKKREQKRLEAMGRYVRQNKELYRCFIQEGAPKLPAYLRKLFEEEIKRGGPLPKGKRGKAAGSKRASSKRKAA